MNKVPSTIVAAVLLSAAFAGQPLACPPDSGASGSPAIDSLHGVIKTFRHAQAAEVNALRDRIDQELVKPNPDRKKITALVKKQDKARSAITNRWIEVMLHLKTLCTPEEFAAFVKDNWGCKCGEADCGCVPRKK